MRAAVLRGGLPRKANESIEDFVAEFIDHITPSEWRLLAMLPRIRHVFELVLVVIALREEAAWLLPSDHPLNPASRFVEVAS